MNAPPRPLPCLPQSGQPHFAVAIVSANPLPPMAENSLRAGVHFPERSGDGLVPGSWPDIRFAGTRPSPLRVPSLAVRSSEGILRRARNLCLASLIEAVRDQTRTVDLKQVNAVLIQPHWRKNCDSLSVAGLPVLTSTK